MSGEPPPPSVQPTAPHDSPEREGRFHHYVGNEIPWHVHVLWIGFWIGAIAYSLVCLLPALKTELLSPP